MEDAEILLGLADRQEAAFTALHNKYAKLLFARAYQLLRNQADAEEAVQSFFANQLLPFRKWSTVVDLKAYLRRGIYNSCLIMMEREKKRNNRNQRFLAEKLSAFPNATEQVVVQPEMKSYEAAMIHQALSSLTVQQRTAMRLLYVEGFRYNDIARAMNITVNSVKTHLRLGRKHMQQYRELFQSLLCLLLFVHLF